MFLDRVQGQHTFLGDLLIAFSSGEELQDVEFTAGEGKLIPRFGRWNLEHWTAMFHREECS